MLATVILYSFLSVAAIQIVYYIFFSVFAFSKNKGNKLSKSPAISVLICAKNEADNLLKNIPFLLEQEYPNFELVLINDASSDNTLEVMEEFKKKNKNIQLVNVVENENFWGNKKYALTLGIKAAKHEHLLFTDADCKPVSKEWIASMASYFTSKKSFVIGYGKYNTQKFSLVNLVVAYETLLTAIQYFSYALLGNPYMGVGRNLAYTKTDFFNVKGFIKHIQVRSGDDDLFVQEAANKQNIAVNFHQDSFTICEAPKTFKDWFRQKRRHISTANHYKAYHQALLGLFFISKLLFWILLPIVFIFSSYEIPLIGLGTYILISYIIVGFSASRLKETKVLFLMPFLEVFLVLCQIAIFSANLIEKPTHWK